MPEVFLTLAGQEAAGYRQRLFDLCGLEVTGPSPRPGDGALALETLKGPLLPRPLGAEIWAVQGGVKPAGRVILHDADGLSRMQQWTAEHGLETLMAQMPVRTAHKVVGEAQDHRGGTLFFFGRDRGVLKELLALDHAILAAADPQETLGAAAAHGRLLGYPPCCVEAFVWRLKAGENRAVKALWFEQTGGLGYWPLNAVNPVGPTLVGFYPCSLMCAHALNYANAVLSHPQVSAAFQNPRFLRAMSGQHWYWLDRLQAWQPPGRPDLAVSAQVLSETGGGVPYGEEVDFLFAACVVVPLRRAQKTLVRDGALVLSQGGGEVRVSHSGLPCLEFRFGPPPK